MLRVSELAVPLFCLLLAVPLACGLKCYRCGRYTTEGAGSIIPCYKYDDSHLQECTAEKQFCLKYLNKGIIVRDCAVECKSGVHELSEFFCCQEDGCNGSPSTAWAATSLLSISIIAIVLRQVIRL